MNALIEGDISLALQRRLITVLVVVLAIGVAAVHAAQEADACLECGDHAGKATWLRVIKAIEELQKAPPKDPGALH
jgi:hypothetical protein